MYSFIIFLKNKSYMQLLQQGELDAIGLRIINGNIQEINNEVTQGTNDIPIADFVLIRSHA